MFGKQSNCRGCTIAIACAAALLVALPTVAMADATESFEVMPTWNSSFDAGWGDPATWTIEAGGQVNNALQATRATNGSSAKVLQYAVTAGTDYRITIYMKCAAGTAYWVETAYKLGAYDAADFDGDAPSWTFIKKFSDTGGFDDGNGDVWTQYTATPIATGAETTISIGVKLGGAHTALWDEMTLTTLVPEICTIAPISIAISTRRARRPRFAITASTTTATA